MDHQSAGVKLVVQTKAAVSHPAVCSFYLRSFFSRCWLTPLSLTSLFCPRISQSAHSVIHVEHHVVGILEYSRGAPLYRRTPSCSRKEASGFSTSLLPNTPSAPVYFFHLPVKLLHESDTMHCFVLSFLFYFYRDNTVRFGLSWVCQVHLQTLIISDCGECAEVRVIMKHRRAFWALSLQTLLTTLKTTKSWRGAERWNKSSSLLPLNMLTHIFFFLVHSSAAHGR